MRNNGSIQNIAGIPQEIKDLYRTVWEMSMTHTLICRVKEALLLTNTVVKFIPWKALQLLN